MSPTHVQAMGGRLRPQRAEVHAWNDQVRVARACVKAVLQHIEKDLGRRICNWRVQRGDAKRVPDPTAGRRGLAMVCEQLLNAHCLMTDPGILLQLRKHGDGAPLVGEAKPLGKQHGRQQVEGRRQTARLHEKLAIKALQPECRAAKQSVLRKTGMQHLDECQCFCVGTEHQMLPVVNLAKLGVVDAPRSSTRCVAGLKDTNLVVGLLEPNSGRQPGPAGAHDADLHCLGLLAWIWRITGRAAPTQFFQAIQSLRMGVRLMR